MRPVGWVVLAGLACVALGFLLGRATAPEPAARRAVPPLASRPWPTVWPEGAPRIAVEVEELLEPSAASPSERLAWYLDWEAEGIRFRRLTLCRGQELPLADPRPLHFERLRCRYLGDAFEDCVASGFSPSSLRFKRSVRLSWRTPFGAYFQYGFVHGVVKGSWRVRRTDPWEDVRPSN